MVYLYFGLKTSQNTPTPIYRSFSQPCSEFLCRCSYDAFRVSSVFWAKIKSKYTYPPTGRFFLGLRHVFGWFKRALRGLFFVPVWSLFQPWCGPLRCDSWLLLLLGDEATLRRLFFLRLVVGLPCCSVRGPGPLSVGSRRVWKGCWKFSACLFFSVVFVLFLSRKS